MRHALTFICFTIGILAIVCLADIEQCLVAQAQQTPDGSVLYKKHCMNCHSETGMASVLTPKSKTRDEWKTFYTEGKHLGQDLTTLADAEKISLIAEHCQKNAKSAAPETQPAKETTKPPESTLETP